MDYALKQDISEHPRAPREPLVDGVQRAVVDRAASAQSSVALDNATVALARLLGRSTARALFHSAASENNPGVDGATVLCTIIIALLLLRYVLEAL